MWLLPVIYLAFISLGLPDSMSGSAWPSMHKDFDVPESFAGILTAMIYSGTIVSSIASGLLIRKFGTRNIVFLSVVLSAMTMYGFSLSHDFTTLCCIALPYGLAGGCIDAALNNYVAIHYKPMHMNFLHCFWGIGTIIGPVIMGHLIETGGVWSQAYSTIAMIQAIIAMIILISFPLWKNVPIEIPDNDRKQEGYSILLKYGVRGTVIAFFLYCAVETSMGLWTVSYMIDVKGTDIATATKSGMLFFVGITAGRIIAGILADRFSDVALISSGIVILISSLSMLIFSEGGNLFPYILIVSAGIGCGPIYPCMLHRAPDIVGVKNSSLLIGTQMASASLGSITFPALAGYVIHLSDMSLFPALCIVLAIAMAASLFIETPK